MTTTEPHPELARRAQFAVAFPTETELSTAVESFASWTEVVRSLRRVGLIRTRGEPLWPDQTCRQSRQTFQVSGLRVPLARVKNLTARRGHTPPRLTCGSTRTA